eukprot:TRINITY_DN5568_c0_g1_i1.p1 TRINITY_DN5568_c0_g1~~TRINITY_DN5568_c0_g1_i1.p1  ORF type:complete len:384 (+),score=72.68 TRINITY_DN5568_c0_g1_i1:103-1152(+)
MLRSLVGSEMCIRDSLCKERYQSVPPELEPQLFQPTVAYPGWDSNWDYRSPNPDQVAKLVGESTPVKDYTAACRRLYSNHTNKSAEQIEKLLEGSDDHEKLFVQGVVRYSRMPTRHIILVRHGQYDETYNKPPHCHGETPRDEMYDVKRVLTHLGQEQALATGSRLAEICSAALKTPGREPHVRLLSSNSTRAIQTADLIGTCLPEHVIRLPNDPNLNEGYPAHRIPSRDVGQEEAECIHLEGARIEAAFRRHFCRADLPAKMPDADSKDEHPNDEYDIIVCHGNVIRYFMLRLMQLPPEAWLRSAPFNCSITHCVIRASGNVSLFSFADTGHLSMAQTTFSMHEGYEW